MVKANYGVIGLNIIVEEAFTTNFLKKKKKKKVLPLLIITRTNMYAI